MRGSGEFPRTKIPSPSEVPSLLDTVVDVPKMTPSG